MLGELACFLGATLRSRVSGLGFLGVHVRLANFFEATDIRDEPTSTHTPQNPKPTSILYLGLWGLLLRRGSAVFKVSSSNSSSGIKTILESLLKRLKREAESPKPESSPQILQRASPTT